VGVPNVRHDFRGDKGVTYQVILNDHYLFLNIINIFIITNMDKSFNFFKAKIKKETEKTRNYSKSNSSKASGSKYSYKAKE